MNTTTTSNQRDHVLVTGATGATGGAVAQALRERGVPVRAMVRKSADAERLSTQGIETVLADFDDDAAVSAALEGSRRAYLVTPSSERAQDQQVRFVQAAARAGVEHLVVLSQLGTRTDSPVRFLRYHAAVEDRVRELGIGYTFLRPNLFFQGLFAFAPTISAHGSMAAPIGDARVSAVDVRDIGAVGAAVLAAGSHLGQVLTITGPEAISHADMASRIGAALGTPVTFSQAPAESFAAALQGVLPPWQVDGLVEDYAHYDRGEASEVTSVVADATGAAARSFDDFLRDHLDVFR